MKRVQVRREWKRKLALLMAFVYISTFLPHMEVAAAKETFDVKEEVTYDADKELATIAFDLDNTDFTILEINDPEGAIIDLEDPTYEVRKNGTYTFKVKYEESSSKSRTLNKKEEDKKSAKLFSKKIVVNGIVEKKNEAPKTPIVPEPRTKVTDDGVTLDISEYDEAAGWGNGVVKDMNVTVNFGDQTSSNKKLCINLPEGLRYELIAMKVGTDTTGVDKNIISSYESSDPLSTSIVSMTLPKKETAPMGATFGQIVYNFTQGTQSVTIQVRASVDMARYYGPHSVPERISAQAYMGESAGAIGKAEQTVEAIGAPVGNGEVAYSSTVTGSTELLTSTATRQSVGVTPSVTMSLEGSKELITRRYAKKIQCDLYYPQGLEFDKLVGSGSVASLYDVKRIDKDQGKVEVETLTNLWRTKGDFQISYKVPIGTEKGTYTAAKPDEVTFTWYDGATTVKTRDGNNHTVKITDVIYNALPVDRGYNVFMDSSVPEHVMFGPNFIVKNNTAGVKTNQMAEFVIEEGWQAFYVQFPFDQTIPGGKVKDIAYKTNLNSGWREYDGPLGNEQNTKMLSTSDIQELQEGEYFTGVRANVGDFSEGFASGYYIATRGHVGTWGSLATGVTSANVEFKMYDADDNSIKSTVTRQAKDSAGDRRMSSGAVATFSKASITAGESFQMTAVIKVGEHEPLYESVHALESPEIYLRQPEGINIGLDTIKIQDENGSVDYEIVHHINEAGEKIYTLKTKNTKIGNYYGEKVEKRSLTVTYSMTPEISVPAKGFNARDLIAWGKNESGIKAVSTFPQAPIIDVHDFNGNQNVIETILSVAPVEMKILESKTVFVETFLSLEGEGIKKPYVEDDASTLAYFTPGTDANYTVKVKNNIGDIASAFSVYVPIPKTGMNFGSSFQSEAFKWDMALNGIIPKKADFEVLYSTDASSKDNYESVNYSPTISETDLKKVTMVKIVAQGGLTIGATEIFEIPLKVDEKFEEAENKIGTKNIYTPCYKVKSQSIIGSFSGTKVGTELVIAEIGGLVFEDKNADGLYGEGDVLISGHTIALYKYNELENKYEPVLDSNNDPVTTTTNGNGEYLFDYESKLGYGKYAVRFSEKGSGYEYTIPNAIVSKIGSNAIINGVDKGKVLEIDPTKPLAKTISCGFLRYDPLSDLGVTVNDEPNQVKVGASPIKVGKVITPNNWDSIKDTTTPYVWEIVGDAAEKAKATLVLAPNGDVVITPAVLPQGTVETSFKLKLTIKDAYGNEKPSNEVTIKIVTNIAPTITAPELVKYVGDSANLWESITAKDAANTPIELVLPPDPMSNTTIVHSIPIGTEKHTIAGTYEVQYGVKDKYENLGTNTRLIRVNGPPTISATPQQYEIEAPGIKERVTENATGNYAKAGALPGGATTPTPLTPIYTIESGPSETFETVGIYKVKYVVKTPENKSANKSVDVFIAPKGLVTVDTVSLGAESFVLNNADAKNITLDIAKTKANVIAVKDTYTNITSKVSVDLKQFGVIKAAPEEGGIYDLTFMVTEGSTKVAKPVKVVVLGTKTTVNNNIAITGVDITLANVEAANFALAQAVEGGKVKGYNLADESVITDLTIDQEEIDAINVVGYAGETLSITVTATSGMNTNSVTLAVIVDNTLVKPTITTTVRAEYYTTDDASDIEVLSAVDVASNSIVIDAEEGGNTKIVHSIPLESDKFKAPGTYEIEYKVKDQWGNEGKVVKVVKVHGLPTLSATPQMYSIEDENIVLSVAGNPKAFWKKASDVVGEEAKDTVISGAAVTYEVKSGPDGTLDFSKVGTYEIEYKATNPDGKAITKMVPVKVLPKEIIGVTLIITANDFSLTSKEAKALTNELAIQKSGVQAHISDEKIDALRVRATSGDINISANAEQVKAIRSVGKDGGVYKLTFVATHTDAQGKITKSEAQVKVTVKAENGGSETKPTNPAKPTKAVDKNNSGVKTGDGTNAIYYIALIFLFGIYIVFRKRQNNRI